MREARVTPGIGHNNGPTLEPGRAWRRYAWGRARAELLPRLPIEIVRRRIRRAREIGLDYSTYATVRAAAVRREHGNVLEAAHPAPRAFATWSETRAAVAAARPPGVAGDAVLLVGDTGAERDWAVAGALAGYLPAERFFS